MSNLSVGTPEQCRDPNYMPRLSVAVPLGIQHVLAMFVANITPAIIIAGAAGFGFGSNSPDFPMMLYMMQMCMLLAGATTLLQTIGAGPIGARLPIVQGTSFAFIPILIPLVAGKGVDAMAAVTGGIFIGGLFQAALAPLVGRLRFALPPLVTGLIVTMIGLSLLKVGIQYAAGGVPAIGTPEYGSLQNWGVASVVIVVTLFSWRIINIAYVDDGRYTSVEENITSETSLVVVNHGAPNQLFYLPYEWYYKGHTLPQSVKALVPGLSSFELERITERKFSIKSIVPLVVNHKVSMINTEGNSPILSRAYSKRMLQGLITHPNTQFFEKQIILQNDMKITVVAVEDGAPKELMIEFVGKESPDNMIWQWYDWSDKMYKSMGTPEVGGVKRYLGPLASM